MDEHEVNVSRNQAVFQPCQSFQFWLIIDGQLVVLAHRWHLVVLHMLDTCLAKPGVLVTIDHNFHTRVRGIPKAILDDVAVWRGRCVVPFSLKMYTITSYISQN